MLALVSPELTEAGLSAVDMPQHSDIDVQPARLQWQRRRHQPVAKMLLIDKLPSTTIIRCCRRRVPEVLCN